MEKVHTMRVLFGDTDAMGVAYYGRYLRWFEVGRTELMRKWGLPYSNLADRGIHLPVRRAECVYLLPARYDDEIHIFSGIEDLKGVRVKFAYRIEKENILLTSGETEHVFTDGEGNVLRPPKEIISVLKRVRDARP